MLKYFLKILLCFVVGHLVGQSNEKNSVSFQFLQIDSYQNYNLGIKPIFDIGIGYERMILKQIGVFGSFSYTKGKDKWPLASACCANYMREVNYKFGAFGKIRLNERINASIKINMFYEASKFYYPLLHYNVPTRSLDFPYKFLFSGMELGIQPELKLFNRFKLFVLASYQYGFGKLFYNSGAAAQEEYKGNISILESLGVKYSF